jgi:carboxymethylenebutenolidase
MVLAVTLGPERRRLAVRSASRGLRWCHDQLGRRVLALRRRRRAAHHGTGGAVPKREVVVPTEDGTADATLHTPEGDGPWPAVIMYPDAGGRRPTFHAMAQRLADLGYAVALPNVYWRAGDVEPFDMHAVYADPAVRRRMMELATTTPKAAVARDTGALLEVLTALPEVAGTAVGTTGYCAGGGHSLVAAGRHPDRVAAAASFHGGYLATSAPDSPHLGAPRIAARVYVASAADDEHFPPEQAELLERALREAGVDHTMETYPAGHGFAVPDNPSYDEAAAERHWTAMATLFGSVLARTGPTGPTGPT